MLTKQELDGLSDNERALYAVNQKILALEDTLTGLALRYVRGQPDATEIEEAMNEIQLELGPLNARFDTLILGSAGGPEISSDDVIALQEAIIALRGLTAATAAVGSLMTHARSVASMVA